MDRPEITGIGLMEHIKEEYRCKSPTKESLSKHMNEDDKKEVIVPLGEKEYNEYTKAINDELKDFKQYNESMESYIQLMDTFLNRKQKRKLSRYKGFKSFTDKIYGK